MEDEGRDPRYYARTTDPETSHEAAKRLRDEDRILVLLFFADGIARIDNEIRALEKRLGRTQDTLRRRASDLRDEIRQWIKAIGKKKTEAGDWALLCRITVKGLRELRSLGYDVPFLWNVEDPESAEAADWRDSHAAGCKPLDDKPPRRPRRNGKAGPPVVKMKRPDGVAPEPTGGVFKGWTGE